LDRVNVTEPSQQHGFVRVKFDIYLTQTIHIPVILRNRWPNVTGAQLSCHVIILLHSSL